MRKKLSVMVTVCLLMALTTKSQILPSFGNSRTATTGFQFLKIIPDARSSGMAGSFISLADDASAMYWNPAGLALTDTAKLHFQFGQTSYYSGMGQSYLGIVYSGSRLNFWGLQVISMSSGEMDVTTEFQPFGNGQTFGVTDLLVGLSFAKVLSDNFSFGLSGKYVYENIANVYVHNGIFDLGFVYNVGFNGNTRFAVGVSNFGFNVSPSGKVTVSTLNGDKVIENFENMAVPSIFRMGVSTRVFHKGIHNLVASAQLTHPTDNNETIAFGAEYDLKNILYLRTGYEFGADQKGMPAAGIGINLQRYFGGIRVDYSFNNKDILGNIHRITLGVSLK